MYDRWTRLTSTGATELGYRQPASPIAASIALLLSVLCLIGALWTLSTSWSDGWEVVATGFFFGFILLMTALQWATVREAWFSRTPPRVTFVRDLLGWRRARVQDLETSGIVTCEYRRDPDESDMTLSYQVRLVSSASPTEPIFIHSYFDHDEPAAIAREIASFLAWEFEDRSLNRGQTPSVTSFVLSRPGFASVVRVGASLGVVGAVVAALGLFIQTLMYFAGACDVAMVLGWTVVVVMFLAMRFIFQLVHHWLSRAEHPADA